jgi:hypothetical protein
MSNNATSVLVAGYVSQGIACAPVLYFSRPVKFRRFYMVGL